MSANPDRVADTRTRRRLVLGGLAVAVVIAAVWLFATRGDGDDRRRSMNDMAGMEGMAGMSMGAGGSARLTADQIRQFGITFGTVERLTLDSEVRTAGVVTLDETRVTQVTPRFDGYAERLHVDFTGQRVRRGQPLLDVYSPELVAVQEELLVARRLERTMGESTLPGVPAGSSDLVAAARRRFRLLDISDAQIEEILRTGVVRRTLTLHAPSGGVVIEKNVVAGQGIQAGQTLYTIADLSEVWVEAELRESEAGSVRVGSGATIELAAFPGRPFLGRVEYVYPTLQEESRTLKARVAVANSDGRLKPGMYATVRIITPTRAALTVPASAIIRTGARSLVFVDMGGGTLMPHEIELGQEGREHVEVLSGLEPGQRVVTSAQFLLESESNFADVMRAMMGQMGTSDMQGMDMPGMDMDGMDDRGAPMPGSAGAPARRTPERR